MDVVLLWPSRTHVWYTKYKEHNGFIPLLTNMIVFPNITEYNVTSKDHGYTTKSSLLHVNVLVVISFIAWERERKQYTRWWTCSLINRVKVKPFQHTNNKQPVPYISDKNCTTLIPNIASSCTWLGCYQERFVFPMCFFPLFILRLAFALNMPVMLNDPPTIHSRLEKIQANDG